ncbi:hypothetical protein ILFOPFJJ_01499 [Ensifer psoraleae]|uniref:hypothetical protein n=1 Tax=Sinorhizobium psoraleae TaxID=520838 RepID=UPI0015682DC1|nr:hypothetical protein [Sinorhizobium psoraleae]NRP70618.1 hypothetical protein [Sinorhizobium psoraleae]
MAITAAEVWRDYETDGVPSSGSHKVKKNNARSWGAWVEGVVNAFTASDGRLFTSLASINVSLGYTASTMAWVIGDPVAANNGVYQKLGDSGTGSWVRRADLPFSFIIASDAGAGTANAIQATTSIPVSGSALVWMNIFEANTGAVTVSFNGETPLTIKTNSGNDVAAGGLTAGMIVLGIVSGSTFRLVSDQASSAVLAACEAAKTAAEAAAAGVNFKNVASRSALKALNTAVTTLAFLGEPAREGVFKWTTGDFSSQITADTSEGVYIKADAIASTVGAWVRQFDGRVFPEWFGALGDGTTSDQTAAAATVASAFASGDEVYWTNTYLTTASVSNFHSVRHFGPGIIKRSGLGEELIIGGGFASSTNWVVGAGWSIGSGVASVSGAGTFKTLYQNLPGPFVVGETYEITYTVTAYTSGDIRVRLAVGATAYHSTTLRTAIGTYTEQITVTQPIDRVYFATVIDGSTLSVDNLSIRKVGTQFAVAPKEGQANILYVAASGGSASNDGLSSSQPFSTLQGAFDAFKHYWPLDGKWVIKLAAGTYSAASQRSARLGPANETETDPDADNYTANGMSMRNMLTIQGPDVGYDPATNPEPDPTAIFDAAGAAAVGIQLERQLKVLAKDIKFQNYNGSSSSGGIAADGHCWLRTENVHTNACNIGLAVYNHSQIEVKGGAVEACAVGIRTLFNCKQEIGNQIAGAVGQGPFIRNCTTAGLQVQEGSTGHSDFVTYEDNAVGVDVLINSRVNLNGSNFKRNTVAVRAASANVFPSGVVWNTGTADANTENLRIVDSGSIAGQNANNWRTIERSTTTFTTAASTAVQTAFTATLDAGLYTSVPSSIYRGKAIRFRCAGTITGTAGTKSFQMRIGGTLLTGAALEADANGGFDVEGTVYLTGNATQKSTIRALAGIGTNRTKVGYTATAVNTASASDLSFTGTVVLGNSADQIVVEVAELEVQG